MPRNSRRSRGMKKMQPAVQTFVVNTPVTSAGQNGSYFIDLSQIASILNRRFYRQGINWMVSGMKILSGVSSTVLIRKLPETWVMENAWVKGFNAWREMNKQGLEDSQQESLEGRFLDFKIYADKDHHDAGYAANLLPVSYDYDQPIADIAVEATAGEWIPSRIFTPITSAGSSTPGQVAEFEVIAVGGNYPGTSTASTYDAVSLIQGYANSRALPGVTDPNRPDDSADVSGFTPENWLAGIFNEGTNQDGEVIQQVSSYDQPPYPYENDGVTPDGVTMYPGGEAQMNQLQVHDLAIISSTTVGSTTYVKGGSFPCGLIRIDHTTIDTAGNLAIQIDMVPGNHRGYLCEPMGA